MHILTVDSAEQGMKLIRFLARRLGLREASELHRWIRTGQVRVNSARSRPFALLCAGDAVRVPPFAALPANDAPQTGPDLVAGLDLGGGLRLLDLTPDVLVLEKPGGLPTQPGSKQTDSVVDRLRALFAGQAYIPAPAHRLDKACSGLLLAGRHHAAQKYLHEAFTETGGAEKVYLAWVSGAWLHDGPRVLRDNLAKQAGGDGSAFERVRAVADQEGRAALCEAALAAGPLQSPLGAVSLLRIRLFSGRTHQIRVQLAERGHPIIGDPKYGGRLFPQLLLHAHQLAVPGGGAAFAGVSAVSWPEQWPAVFRAAPNFTIRHPGGIT